MLDDFAIALSTHTQSMNHISLKKWQALLKLIKMLRTVTHTTV